MTRVDPIVHAIERIPVGTGSLNDLLVEDIEGVVHFWHGGALTSNFSGSTRSFLEPQRTHGNALFARYAAAILARRIWLFRSKLTGNSSGTHC